MDSEVKNILESKTFWVNLFTVIAIIANRNTQVIDPKLIEPLAMVVLPLVNIGLRAVTKQPVRLGSK